PIQRPPRRLHTNHKNRSAAWRRGTSLFDRARSGKRRSCRSGTVQRREEREKEPAEKSRGKGERLVFLSCQSTGFRTTSKSRTRVEVIHLIPASYFIKKISAPFPAKSKFASTIRSQEIGSLFSQPRTDPSGPLLLTLTPRYL